MDRDGEPSRLVHPIDDSPPAVDYDIETFQTEFALVVLDFHQETDSKQSIVRSIVPRNLLEGKSLSVQTTVCCIPPPTKSCFFLPAESLQFLGVELLHCHHLPDVDVVGNDVVDLAVDLVVDVENLVPLQQHLIVAYFGFDRGGSHSNLLDNIDDHSAVHLGLGRVGNTVAGCTGGLEEVDFLGCFPVSMDRFVRVGLLDWGTDYCWQPDCSH